MTALSIVLGGLLLEQQGRLFQSTVCKYLGDASYSIYLFHLFALGGIWAVAKHFLPIAHMPVYLAVSGLAVVLSLGAGLLAHHMFERPLHMIVLSVLGSSRKNWTSTRE